MTYTIGVLIGAFLVTLLLSRVTLWAFKALGDNRNRVLAAQAVAYGAAVVLGGLGYADGGPPRFGYAATIYILPTVLWLGMDLLALKGRMSKGQASN